MPNDAGGLTGAAEPTPWPEHIVTLTTRPVEDGEPTPRPRGKIKLDRLLDLARDEVGPEHSGGEFP